MWKMCESFLPFVGCVIIVWLHLNFLYPLTKFADMHKLEHRCIICAYLIFAIHYLAEFASHAL